MPRNTIGSWISGDGDRLQTPRRLQSEQKCLCYVAVSLAGEHYFKIADGNINSETYKEFISEMSDHMGTYAQIQTENMVLIQDNARPHVSRETLAYFGEKNIRLLKQAPYSPDMNMLDSFIFPRLESMRNTYEDFKSRDDLISFLNSALPTFTADKMKRNFEIMKEDFQKIIDKDGDYL